MTDLSNIHIFPFYSDLLLPWHYLYPHLWELGHVIWSNGPLPQVVIPLLLRERREREREHKVRHSNAACVGPMWLQWHSCRFIKGINNEERGDGHIRAKQEKSNLYFWHLANVAAELGSPDRDCRPVASMCRRFLSPSWTLHRWTHTYDQIYRFSTYYCRQH